MKASTFRLVIALLAGVVVSVFLYGEYSDHQARERDIADCMKTGGGDYDFCDLAVMREERRNAK